MTQRKGQPFLFDHHVFDDDGQMSLKHKGPPLEFTAPDMEQARQEAYEQGRKAGFAEGQAGLVKQILTLVQSIKQNASMLFASEDERKALYETEALHLSYTVIRKVFPLLHRHSGIDDVRERLGEVMRSGVKGRALTIEVPAAVFEETRTYMMQEGLTPEAGFNLSASPTLRGTECRVSWADGGAIHDPADIARKILAIFEETLAAKGIPVHDAGDVFFDPAYESKAASTAAGTGAGPAPGAPGGAAVQTGPEEPRSVPKKATPSRRGAKKKDTGDHAGE